MCAGGVPVASNFFHAAGTDFRVAVWLVRIDKDVPAPLPASSMKPKPLTEAQFLTFLEKALSQVLPDLKLRTVIHEAVSKEIRLHNNVASFTKFAEEGSVPDLKPETVAGLQEQIASTFGSDAAIAITPDVEGKGVGIEIHLARPHDQQRNQGPAGGCRRG